MEKQDKIVFRKIIAMRILYLLLFLLPGTVHAQHRIDSVTPGRGVLIVDTPKPAAGEVWRYVDKMPEFNGNVNAYIQQHILYPADAKAQHKQGRVNVQFMITEKGKLTNVSVIKPVYPSLDAEAIRIIKQMPDWKPAMLGGKPVRISYTLPVYFKR